MNWDAIGAMGEIVGALAVCLTLVYLASQIRDSRKTTLAQSIDSIHSSWNREINKTGENLETAGIMAKAVADYPNLSQPERQVFHVRMHSILWEHQRQHFFYEQGAWDWESRGLNELAIVSVLISPGGSAWWSEAKEFYIHADYFDNLIADKGTQIDPVSTKSWLRIDESFAGG